MRFKTLKFVISKYRKPKKSAKPIKRSKYAEILFQEGAGWNEKVKQERN